MVCNFNPALERQRQADFCVLQASLVDRELHNEAPSQQKKQKKKKVQKPDRVAQAVRGQRQVSLGEFEAILAYKLQDSQDYTQRKRPCLERKEKRKE